MFFSGSLYSAFSIGFSLVGGLRKIANRFNILRCRPIYAISCGVSHTHAAPYHLPTPILHMKYPLYISGAGPNAGADQQENTHRSEYHTKSAPLVRRFPPAVQFLSRCEQFIEDQVQAIALRTFKAGKSVDEVCAAMYKTALSLGYIITIGVQEVYSSNMPSFPKETVMSCLIMIDFTPAGLQGQS